MRPPTGQTLRRIRPIVGWLAVLLLVLVVYHQRDALRTSLASLTSASILASFLAVLVGFLANMMCWRSLLRGLGSPLALRPSARIFYLSQLGKYAPGSVWPIVAQAELGRDYGIPRTRSALAALLVLAVGIVTATALALPALMVTSREAVSTYWWLGLIGMGALVSIHPAVLQRLVRFVYRLRSHGGEPEPVRTRDLLAASGWSALMWLVLGLHAYLLARDLAADSPSLYVLCVAAFAISWVIGFVVVFAPAGAGAREAALVIVLLPAMTGADALSLAVVSRVLLSVADLLCAGAAVLASKRRGATTPQALGD